MGTVATGSSPVVKVIVILLLALNGGYGKKPEPPKPSAQICCVDKGKPERCETIEGNYGAFCFCFCNQDHHPVCVCIEDIYGTLGY